MEPNSEKIKKPVNPLVIGGFALGVVLIVLLVITLKNLLRTNAYGDEVRIDNFTTYFNNVPQNEKDLIFHQLYTIISNNMSGEIPKDGAVVREGTSEYRHNKSTKVYYGKFIVDIPTIEQSYSVQFEWSPDADSEYLGGYPVMMSCVPKAERIYQNFSCKDFAEKTVSWDNEYQLDYTFGLKTSYKITDALGDYWKKKIDDVAISAVLDETSLVKRESIGTDLVYQFKVIVNDEYAYIIDVRMDEFFGEKYLAIFANDGEDVAGFVETNDENILNVLSNWILSLAGKEVEISTLDS